MAGRPTWLRCRRASPLGDFGLALSSVQSREDAGNLLEVISFMSTDYGSNSVGHLMTSFESHYAAMLDEGFEAEVDGMTSPELMPQGGRALYRAVFRGMQVHGLPEELTIAGATLRFHQGPVLVQQTDLSQRAGYPLVFDKSMNHVRLRWWRGHAKRSATRFNWRLPTCEAYRSSENST